MHKIILTAAVFGLSSTMAFAQAAAPVFADLDTDASGEVSLTELQVAWPDFTQEAFIAADTDASGGLSADEIAAISATATTGTANPTATTGAGTVGNPSGNEGTPADDSDEDEASPSGSTTN